MKSQYAPFLLPLWMDSPEQEALNRFIRGHKIIQSRKELVAVEDQHYWAIFLEYLDVQDKGNSETLKNRVDYKELLSPEDFVLFSKLREVRKRLAEENGLPVYAVCTNEQLAEVARRKPSSAADCMKIEGIGQGKAEKYVPALIACVTGKPNENSPDLLGSQLCFRQIPAAGLNRSGDLFPHQFANDFCGRLVVYLGFDAEPGGGYVVNKD
jgi:hypothetical protein